MRVFGPILIVSAGVLAQSAAPLLACGDKFLLVGRGVTYHRAYGAIYPASIVVYAPPQRNATKAIRDPRFQADLKLAGHRVVVVESDAALARALESDRVDFLLTDVADADRLSRQAVAAASAPGVLPVMYEPTKEEIKQVEARYHCQLKSSDRVDRYLSSIDDAMKARVAQKKKSS
jgi:ABC-type amino acid transport substrate-binding protein